MMAESNPCHAGLGLPVRRPVFLRVFLWACYLGVRSGAKCRVPGLLQSPEICIFNSPPRWRGKSENICYWNSHRDGQWRHFVKVWGRESGRQEVKWRLELWVTTAGAGICAKGRSLENIVSWGGGLWAARGGSSQVWPAGLRASMARETGVPPAAIWITRELPWTPTGPLQTSTPTPAKLHFVPTPHRNAPTKYLWNF